MSTIRIISKEYRQSRQQRREAAAAKASAQRMVDIQAALRAGMIKMPKRVLPSKVDEIISRQFLLERKEWTPEEARKRGIRVGTGAKREFHTYDRPASRSKYTPHIGAKQDAKLRVQW